MHYCRAPLRLRSRGEFLCFFLFSFFSGGWWEVGSGRGVRRMAGSNGWLAEEDWKGEKGGDLQKRRRVDFSGAEEGSRGRRGIGAEGKPFYPRLRTQVWRWWAFLHYIIWFSSLHIVDPRQGLLVFAMIFILLFSFSVFSVFPQMTET